MIGWSAVGAGAVALVVAAVVTARRPDAPVPDRAGYYRRWSTLHGGIDPRGNAWLNGWLTMSYSVARPLARRGVHPDVLTFTSTLVAGAGLVVAIEGAHTRWQMLAGWLIVVSGLGDTLDGAVAVATDRTSRFGYVLDSLVDRVNDVLYVLAAVAVGAPAWLGASTVVGFFLLEYVRARAANAGGDEVGTVTVGERAVRVICCSIAVHWGGVFQSIDTFIATLLVAILAGLTMIGLGQILVAVRRDLLRLDRQESGASSTK